MKILGSIGTMSPRVTEQRLNLGRDPKKVRYNGPVKAVILDWSGTLLDAGVLAPAVVIRRCLQKIWDRYYHDRSQDTNGSEKRSTYRCTPWIRIC